MGKARRVVKVPLLSGVLAVALVGTVCAVGPAGAATGDAALQRHLIRDPLSRAVALTPSTLSAYYTSVSNAENTATAGTGVTIAVAVNGWHIAHNTQRVFIDTLIAVTGAGKPSSLLDSVASLAAAAAAKSTCQGASGAAPTLDVPVAHVPNSSYVLCKPNSSGTVVAAITTARANVVAILATSNSTMTRNALIAATKKQYSALPKAGLAG
jgi:hypothetical protein